MAIPNNKHSTDDEVVEEGFNESNDDFFMDYYNYIQESALSAKERNELKDSEFGIPELRQYPLNDEVHVRQANSFFKFAPKKYKAELAKRIFNAAKKFNIDTENWQIHKYLSKYETIQESAELHENVIEVCQKIHNFLSGCEYGIKANGKLLTPSTDKDWEQHYRFLSYDEFVEDKTGICWDFTNYTRHVLLKNHIPFKQYFMMCDVPGYISHTFTLCDYKDDKVILVEASFKEIDEMIGGVKIFDNFREVTRFIASMMFSDNRIPSSIRSFKYDVIEFHGHPQYHSTGKEYVEWMYERDENEMVYQSTATIEEYNKFKEEYDDVERLYFYHLIPKNVKLDSKGLKTPEYVYKVENNKKLYLDMVDKYRYRLCNGWDIYPKRDPDSLAPKEIYDGINKFRDDPDGNNQIYMFRYPPSPDLGPNMREVLKDKVIYAFDILDPKNKEYIKKINWGFEGSHTGNEALTREYYENITEEEYFANYDDNAKMLFASLNHISVNPVKGYIPTSRLKKTNHKLSENSKKKVGKKKMDKKNTKSSIQEAYHNNYNCISFAMGVDRSITGLKSHGFEIVKEDDGYNVRFNESHASVWEDYIEKNMADTYWNEYINLDTRIITFMIKENDKITKVTNHDMEEDDTLLETCNRLCDGNFKTIKELIYSNDFYKEHLESNQVQEFTNPLEAIKDKIIDDNDLFRHILKVGLSNKAILQESLKQIEKQNLKPVMFIGFMNPENVNRTDLKHLQKHVVYAADNDTVYTSFFNSFSRRNEISNVASSLDTMLSDFDKRSVKEEHIPPHMKDCMITLKSEDGQRTIHSRGNIPMKFIFNESFYMNAYYAYFAMYEAMEFCESQLYKDISNTILSKFDGDESRFDFENIEIVQETYGSAKINMRFRYDNEPYIIVIPVISLVIKPCELFHEGARDEVSDEMNNEQEMTPQMESVMQLINMMDKRNNDIPEYIQESEKATDPLQDVMDNCKAFSPGFATSENAPRTTELINMGYEYLQNKNATDDIKKINFNFHVTDNSMINCECLARIGDGEIEILAYPGSPFHNLKMKADTFDDLANEILPQLMSNTNYYPEDNFNPDVSYDVIDFTDKNDQSSKGESIHHGTVHVDVDKAGIKIHNTSANEEKPYQEMADNGLIKVDNVEHNIMYFGSDIDFGDNSLKLDKPKLFLTPYIGIASIFTTKRSRYGIPPGLKDINLAYEEWYSPELDKPFDEIHVIVEGCPELKERRFEATGYIYAIDISKYKDNIYQEEWMNSSKEFLLCDVPIVPIHEKIKHPHVVYVKGADHREISDTDNNCFYTNFHVPITKENVEKYKKSGNAGLTIGLQHLRVNSNVEGYIWPTKNGEVIAYVAVEQKDEGRFIIALEIAERYQGKGFGKKLLTFAEEELNADHLSVNKNNTNAFKLYLDCGWEVYDETDTMFFMKKDTTEDDDHDDDNDDEIEDDDIEDDEDEIDTEYVQEATKQQNRMQKFINNLDHVPSEEEMKQMTTDKMSDDAKSRIGDNITPNEYIKHNVGAKDNSHLDHMRKKYASGIDLDSYPVEGKDISKIKSKNVKKTLDRLGYDPETQTIETNVPHPFDNSQTVRTKLQVDDQKSALMGAVITPSENVIHIPRSQLKHRNNVPKAIISHENGHMYDALHPEATKEFKQKYDEELKKNEDYLSIPVNGDKNDVERSEHANSNEGVADAIATTNTSKHAMRNQLDRGKEFVKKKSIREANMYKDYAKHTPMTPEEKEMLKGDKARFDAGNAAVDREINFRKQQTSNTTNPVDTSKLTNLKDHVNDYINKANTSNKQMTKQEMFSSFLDYQDNDYVQESKHDKTLPDGVSLRPADESDLPNIIEWKLDSVNSKTRNNPETTSFIENDAKENLKDTKMIMSHSTVIGILESCYIDDGEWWYIGEIYLIPEYRGKGIARTILQQEIDSHNKLKLRVSKDNTHAIDLYKSLGFGNSEEDEYAYIMTLVKDNMQEDESTIQESAKVRNIQYVYYRKPKDLTVEQQKLVTEYGTLIEQLDAAGKYYKREKKAREKELKELKQEYGRANEITREEIKERIGKINNELKDLAEDYVSDRNHIANEMNKLADDFDLTIQSRKA